MRSLVSVLTALLVSATLVLVGSPADAATRYTVTAYASTTKVDVGQSFTLTGKVTPRARGQKVLVQRLSGSTWSTVKKATLNRRSKYAATIKVTAPGENRYRVVKPRSNGHPKGISPTVTVVGWRWRSLTSLPVWNPPGAPSTSFVVLSSGMMGPVSYSPFIKLGSPSTTVARVTYLLEGKCTRFDGHVAVTPDSASGNRQDAYLVYYNRTAGGPFIMSQIPVFRDIPDPLHIVRTATVMSQVGALTLQAQTDATSTYIGWGAVKVYCRS